MISDAIEDRTVHIFRIHQFDMSLQAFFIADIPGMNDKSRLFIPGIVTHIIHPVFKVSDGLNVVETAADGSFTLPGHERERFIYIYTTCVSSHNGHCRQHQAW